MNILQEIFSGGISLFEKASVEYENGSSVSLESASDFKKEVDGENVHISATIPAYKVSCALTHISDVLFEAAFTLSPLKSSQDKAHKITSVQFSLPYDDNSRFLINHDFQEGIFSADNLPQDCACKDFFSFYDVDSTKNALTVCTALPSKFRSDIYLDKKDGEFSLSLTTTLPYGFEGEVQCQKWLFFVGISPDCAFERAADMFKSKKSFASPVGWSTWDYYFTSATEDDVKKNVDFIADDPILSKKVKYIAIDDGWQQREGDWESGIRYKSGLKSLVDYIKSKGFEAGIWIAPTRLHFLCSTVMRRNDFLVRDKYGDPAVDEDMYILDPTHPDGEKFLRETFSYLADCGFTFYKLDFISNIRNIAESFYDKTAGHFDVLKRLFDIVRSEVPAHSHLMGCSLPYSMGADVADSRRTGWDIHNTWGHIKACTGSYIAQFASNGKIFRNDLDYLVVRGKETSDDKMLNVLNPKAGYNALHPSDKFIWRAGNDFSYSEAKLWCSVMLMSGSSIFMGDNLPLLNEKGLDLVRKTVSESDFTAATPVFSSDSLPAVWYKKALGKLYIFNFSCEEKTFTVTLSALGLPGGTYEDVFTNTKYSLDDTFSITLKAHDCACLYNI